MEFQVSKSGRKSYTAEQKQIMLNEIAEGAAIGEIARKYGVPIQNLSKWKSLSKTATQGALKSNDEMVPANEYRKAHDEIKKLQRALGRMTLERDILKDAVDIATKKKWI